jgi:hypothetical protein
MQEHKEFACSQLLGSYQVCFEKAKDGEADELMDFIRNAGHVKVLWTRYHSDCKNTRVSADGHIIDMEYLRYD